MFPTKKGPFLLSLTFVRKKGKDKAKREGQKFDYFEKSDYFTKPFLPFFGTILRNLIAKMPGQPRFLCEKGPFFVSQDQKFDNFEESDCFIKPCLVFLGTVLRNLIAKVPGQPCFLCKKGEPVKGTESKGGLKTEKAIRNYPKPKKAILDSSWLSNIAGNYF